jgi:hypothetical protein
METMTKLERAVLDKLFAGKSEPFHIFRQQLAVARVVGRELTGVGFFINFSVPPEAPRLPGRPRFYFGDVGAEIKGVQHGAGFLLLVEDGCLKTLEGYTFDDPWPDDASSFTLHYDNGANRDEAEVIKSFERG